MCCFLLHGVNFPVRLLGETSRNFFKTLSPLPNFLEHDQLSPKKPWEKRMEGLKSELFPVSSIFCRTAEHQRAHPGSATPTSRPLLCGNRWTWALNLLPGHFWYLLLDLSCCTHSWMKYHWGQRIKRLKKRTSALVRAVKWDRGDFFSAQSTNCPKNGSDWVPSFYFHVCTWPLPSL